MALLNQEPTYYTTREEAQRVATALQFGEPDGPDAWMFTVLLDDNGLYVVQIFDEAGEWVGFRGIG